MTTRQQQKRIYVFAHWKGLSEPKLMGTLFATPSRRKEVFSFEYEKNWVQSEFSQILDPSLLLMPGQQYTSRDVSNFGLFLDSSPDRWGRVLMQRREEQIAREESRNIKALLESDYLLGVFDGHRMGALRFKSNLEGVFLDDRASQATPPWTSLRELEHASLQLEEKDPEKKANYGKWLHVLVAPGSSLGGARPKASVIDPKGELWIAKFPSRGDLVDTGAWEAVANELAKKAGLNTPSAQSLALGGREHTYLTKRFDRTENGERLHFASAMTLIQRSEGDDASTGASYLELAEFLQRFGSNTNEDLEELWRRITFFICISNIDDHLRNHGFLLNQRGWRISPAYDMNPVALGDGLKLNISEADNTQDLDLARSVAKFFRIKESRAEEIIREVKQSVRTWRKTAEKHKISRREQDQMSPAFRFAEAS